MYSFKCGDYIKIKLKGVSKSQTKHIKFEEYKKCLDGENFQKVCNNSILRSIDLEMYLQRVHKSTPCIFDDERCSIIRNRL